MPLVQKKQIKEEVRAVPAPIPQPQVISPIINIDLKGLEKANEKFAASLAEAVAKATSGKKRVTVRVLDRDRDGRIERAVFDIVPVKE